MKKILCVLLSLVIGLQISTFTINNNVNKQVSACELRDYSSKREYKSQNQTSENKMISVGGYSPRQRREKTRKLVACVVASVLSVLALGGGCFLLYKKYFMNPKNDNFKEPKDDLRVDTSAASEICASQSMLKTANTISLKAIRAEPPYINERNNLYKPTSNTLNSNYDDVKMVSPVLKSYNYQEINRAYCGFLQMEDDLSAKYNNEYKRVLDMMVNYYNTSALSINLSPLNSDCGSCMLMENIHQPGEQITAQNGEYRARTRKDIIIEVMNCIRLADMIIQRRGQNQPDSFSCFSVLNRIVSELSKAQNNYKALNEHIKNAYGVDFESSSRSL